MAADKNNIADSTYQVIIDIPDYCLELTQSFLMDPENCGKVILPVTLLYFNAYAKPNAALLQWATATEANNRGFYIQRSTDGANWNDITFIPSQAEQGNSHEELHYAYTDHNIASGKYFYRLRQTDADGKSTYSRTEQVWFGTAANPAFTLAPNPAKGSVAIGRLQGGENIRVCNMLGQLVLQGRNNAAGKYTLPLGTLPAGVYTVHITAANGYEQTQKLVVQQ
jgi:hypothetical protein